MNILHINTSADTGGAARAMLRLHRGLCEAGHPSYILTRSRTVTRPNLFTVGEATGYGERLSERLVRALAIRVDRLLGIPDLHLSTPRIMKSELFRGADVVHLHNLHGCYFNYHLLPELSTARPTVWTLHDMWGITGHCAYSYACDRWLRGCHSCPLLKTSNRELVEPGPTAVDRTRSVWHRKRRTYEQSNLRVVTPSQWLHGIVHQSILANARSISYIPYGIDIEVFHPVDQRVARNRLDIPVDIPVILFVSEKLTNRRKGYGLLLQALDRIANPESVILLTFGSSGTDSKFNRFRCRKLGFLSDTEQQRLAYSAADVFVFPTLADNQPLVVLESMACGTPVVSFDVGGVPEMVRHMETGFLADYRCIEELAGGIQTVLDNSQLRSAMGRRCREVAIAEYALDLQAERYLSLYEEAIQGHAQRTEAGR